MQTFEQDANVYEFPDDCVVMADFDKKPFFTRLSGAQAIQAKGCDIIAIPDGDTLYLIEAKDYSHKNPGEMPPKAPDLARTIARKSFDTLACLMIGATQSEDETVDFCRKALACTRIMVCATVEPSRKVDTRNREDARYLMQLRECLRREAKGLVRSQRDIMVTRNADAGRKGKFWTSHWALSHD
ncbi:hypothetical protein [Bifidobacterium parmae]|uniref:Uncharacterized protein n=1 Tax=Bifidobacterium parmae TaxID=361854 RepID=A0A2N5J393_9BIFI|nr:hypothetical protein [Bifidobacterium parmae]PLS28691.1 hypothetical protein Uis4E_1233 [Bifidobacterium parmae]